MSYTIKEPHCPSCEVFVNGYNLICADAFMTAIHGGTPDIPLFTFCPWCGSKLEYTAKTMPGERLTLEEFVQRVQAESTRIEQGT